MGQCFGWCYKSDNGPNSEIWTQTRNDTLESQLKAAKGCILGAFIGDAAGAVLEFYNKRIKQEHVDHALTFPGGGVF